MKRLPDVEQREEVGIGARKAAVRRIGLGLFVERPLARILDAEAGGDHQHLPQASFGPRLQDHAAHGGVHRQPGEFVSDRREVVAGVAGLGPGNRPQFLQQLVARAHRLGRRGVDEGESLDVAKAKDLHAQDDVGEIGALDFGLGETRALQVVLLGIEADANALGHAAATALALVGAALRDRLDRQASRAGLRRIAADARQPGVDHEADPRDGERGLRNVGGDDDLAFLGRREHALLLGVGQAAEQRDDLRAGEAPALEQVACFADVALGGHEDEEVARRAFAQDPLDRLHRSVDVVERLRPRHRLVVGRGIGAELVQWRVDHLDRIEPAGNLDDGRVVEGPGKSLGVDRRRGDDRPQLGPAEAELAQVAEQEINIERALVGLVDDQGVVLPEQRVALQLGEQHAVGEVFDDGLGRGVVGEPDLAADFAAPWHAQLLRHPARNRQRGHPARLRAGDAAGGAAAGGEAHLGNLRRLAGSGFARQDQHRVPLDGRRDFLRPRADGQLGGKIQAETGGSARHEGRS